MKNVAFLGGGSFGTALSLTVAKNGYNVSVWANDMDVVCDINENHQNIKYIKDIKLPETVVAYYEAEKALEGAEMVVLAVPSHAIRPVCNSLKNLIPKDAIVVSVAKGLEQGTGKRLSEVIKEELPNEVVILSGPSHAEEIALEMPTTLVTAGDSEKAAKVVQDVFMGPNLRIYTNNDIVGVEIGGAVKNIIALAAGILDGLGYGDNANAALMTRGMSEIIRAGEKMGGRRETFYGLTGMGDLIVTCTSKHSRNRRAGGFIAEGYSVDEACDKVGMVVEGVKACKVFYEKKEELGVSMPITDLLYKVLFEGACPKEAITLLMTRDKKREFE